MNMLKAKLNKKLGKNGGFTLVEMLIVVAIIAILVAVSIPLVSSSLEKAKISTDKANMRAAKAEATLMILNHQIDPAMPEPLQNWWYDNETGTFSANVPDPYNKSDDAEGSGKTENKAAIQITAHTVGESEFTLSWENTTP